MAFLLTVPALAQEEAGLVTYEVTIENLTEGQPFSPPLAATHQQGFHVFQVGALAGEGVEQVAENGKFMPLAEHLKGLNEVTQVTPVIGDKKPIPPGTSDTFQISAASGNVFSIISMAICTNDGITGLDSVGLPEQGSTTFLLEGYDAGTEDNTGLSQDVLDTCSKILPNVALPGDPDGNADAPVATVPAQPISIHPLPLNNELGLANLGWTNPMARVTITRLDGQQAAPSVIMPDTGGPSLFLLPVAALLLSGGILGLAVLRRAS